VPLRFVGQPNEARVSDNLETLKADSVPGGLSRTGPGLPALRVML
jgi:hypothetical protein